MNISAIIRCKNEESWIGHAIQSVLDFIDDPEIVVVDNESTDGSMEIVRMFETFWDVKTTRIANYSPGRCLNQAAKECKHNNILILSAHCSIVDFDEKDIKNHIEKHVTVFGNQIPIYRGKRLLKRYIWSNFSDEICENMWSSSEGRYFLHNAFAIYQKQYLLDHPFDETLYGKEDRYWAADTIERGQKILYHPGMVCKHYWTNNGATWKGIG